MEKNIIKEINAAEGMKIVSGMMRLQYVAKVMSENYGGTEKSNLVLILSGMNHTLRCGRAYYYSNEFVDRLQKTIRYIGKQLLDVDILEMPQRIDDYPLCYGDTYQEKFKQFSNYISVPNLFVNIMGRTLRWQKMHLHDKREKYYNNFTDAELAEINNGIRYIALTLCNLKLQYETNM